MTESVLGLEQATVSIDLRGSRLLSTLDRESVWVQERRDRKGPLWNRSGMMKRRKRMRRRCIVVAGEESARIDDWTIEQEDGKKKFHAN